MKKLGLAILMILCMASSLTVVACDKGCDHSFGEWQTGQPATCVNGGAKSRECVECGEKEIESIPANGHDMKFYSTDVSTCNKYRYWQKCVNCETTEYVENDELANGSHSYTDNVCVECGEEYPATSSEYFTFTLLDDDTYGISVKDVSKMPASVVIPSTYDDKPITVVEQGAFYNCLTVTTLTVSGNVNIIEQNAFCGCANLKSLTLGSSVTKIEYGAFSRCNSLTEVKIPENVTVIAGGAFSNCAKLDKFTVSENNETYKSVDGNLYSKDGTTLVQYAIGKLSNQFVIPSGVTGIADYAFAYCNVLTNLTVSNGVEQVGEQAFYGCYNLIEIKNESNLEITAGSSENGYLGYYASNVYTPDSGATKISTDTSGYIIYTDEADVRLLGYEGKGKNLTLPQGITEINGYAFYGNDSLLSVNVPDSVTKIGENAFGGCSNLLSVTVGSGVTSIAQTAFDGCFKLLEVYNKSLLTITKGDWRNGYVAYYAKQVYTDSYTSKISTDADGYISYTDGTSKILLGYDGTETVLTMPSGITEMYDYAFVDNKNVLSVTISNEVTKIGKYAFLRCENLINVYVPNGIMDIGINAFEGCRKLRYNAYNNALYLGNTGNYYVVLVSARSQSISSCEIHANTRLISYYAFSGCENLTSIVLPDNVKSIGQNAFAFCYNLTTVVLPTRLLTVGDWAFEYCKSLTQIVIPDSVTTVGKGAFYTCEGLLTVTVGGGVTDVGDMAFEHCYDLQSVTIGRGVRRIGESAFYGCESLESVAFENANNWWVTSAYDATSGTDLLKTDLENPATAAELLAQSYATYYWRRG